MNKEEIDKYQKDYYGDTYEELSQQYCAVVELYSKSVKRKGKYKRALLDIKEYIKSKTTNEKYGNLNGDEWYKKELHLSREELKDLLDIVNKALGDKE